MRTATARRLECKPLPPVLYMALELAEGTWKLGFTVAFGQRPRLREIPARDTTALLRRSGMRCVASGSTNRPGC